MPTSLMEAPKKEPSRWNQTWGNEEEFAKGLWASWENFSLPFFRWPHMMVAPLFDVRSVHKKFGLELYIRLRT